jgi:hypothetical protein
MEIFRYAEYVLCATSPPFPIDKFPSVKDLALGVIRQFRPAALRSDNDELSAGAERRPVEAQYQDEFYRGCYRLLNNHIYLSSEWAGRKSGGRVDFQVTSLGWAIECLRDGDRLDEHIARFQELPTEGRYYKWIEFGEIKDYVILDFRSSRPETPKGKSLTV